MRRLILTLRDKPSSAIGVAIVGIAVVMVLLPYPFARFSPTAVTDRQLAPPDGLNWFGTDINGLDVFSRIVWGARIDLTIAITSALIAVAIGTVMGAWAGYHFGGKGWQGLLSDVLMRATDALQAFPVFVLALALVAFLGRNIFNLIFVLVFLGIPTFLRLTRSSVIATRSETYVDAARCSGNSEVRMILRHLLPNAITPTLVLASAVAGQAILLTAGLSFVGAGVPAPTPEWGYMVSVGAPNLYTGQWWPAVFPGICIGLVVLGFALIGDGIQHFLDPTT